MQHLLSKVRTNWRDSPHLISLLVLRHVLTDGFDIASYVVTWKVVSEWRRLFLLLAFDAFPAGKPLRVLIVLHKASSQALRNTLKYLWITSNGNIPDEDLVVAWGRNICVADLAGYSSRVYRFHGDAGSQSSLRSLYAMSGSGVSLARVDPADQDQGLIIEGRNATMSPCHYSRTRVPYKSERKHIGDLIELKHGSTKEGV